MTVPLIIFCCWIVSFFFNGIESGLLSIDLVRLRQNVKRRVPAALQLNRLLKHPERLLATVLLVTNAADIVALLLLTSELVRSHGYAGFFFALLIALPVYLFVLAVLPKSLFRRFPFRALARLAGVLEFASILFSPLLEIGARFGKLLLPSQAARRRRLFAAREELKQITAQSEREGALTSTERAMIHSLVDFRGTKVRDVMLPSAKVVTLRSGASTGEALELSASTGLDRLPVVTPDGQPAGLVNVIDILFDRNGSKPLGNYVRRIVTATEDEPAYRIMQQLRAARLGLAAVVDGKEKFRGIVAIEDLIRRFVSPDGDVTV
ncbi:MAG: CNNM domain-containing protein [Alphaproteobacteria bacterium]